jgi:hypothetical protein
MRPLTLSMILLAAAIAAPLTQADDACTDFKWDVSKERALFAKSPTPLKAGADAKAAPTVLPETLYQIQLASQNTVKFVLEPGRKSHADSDHGGIAIIKLPASGAYRIALGLPLWIDVVAKDTLVPAKDFQGQHDCSAPHKIVEFELANEQTLTLQLSSSAADSVRLTITPSPPRKL